MNLLNKLLNTNKKIYLSGISYTEQFFFTNGFLQTENLLSQISIKKELINYLSLIIYKKTLIGITIEFSNELYLITPLISKIDFQLEFYNILFNFQLNKYFIFNYIIISNIYEFMNSLVTYFSITCYDNNKLILKEQCCSSYIYYKSRIMKVLDTIKKLNINTSTFGDKILEICCGVGLSTIGLKLNNIIPTVCIDNDMIDLSTGFYYQFLNPMNTICLDAMDLSIYFSSNFFDSCIGFMIGSIYNFNEYIWKSILHSSFKVLKKNGIFLITVRTIQEINLIDLWFYNMVTERKVIDNRDEKTEYDQWIYYCIKK